MELYAVSRCRATVSRVFAVEGEDVEVRVTIENPTPVSVVTAEVSVAYSQYLKLVGGVRAFLTIIPAKGSVTLTLRFRSRVGKHAVGPLRLAVRDVFGFFRFDYTVDATGVVRCVPRASETTVRRLMIFLTSSSKFGMI